MKRKKRKIVDQNEVKEAKIDITGKRIRQWVDARQTIETNAGLFKGEAWCEKEVAHLNATGRPAEVRQMLISGFPHFAIFRIYTEVEKAVLA